jgi:hypothetical protein
MNLTDIRRTFRFRDHPEGLSLRSQVLRICYEEYGYYGSPFMLDVDAAGRFLIRRWEDSEILMEVYE